MISRSQRWRLVGLLVVVVAILLLAAYVLSRAGGASWFAAIVFLTLAILAVATIAVALSAPRRRLTVLPDGGVGLSNSPVIAVLLVALLVAVLLLLTSLAIVWASAGERPLSAAGPSVMLVLVAIGLVPVLVGLIRGRFRLGGLRLAPEGVEYTSFVRVHSLRWDDMCGVVRTPGVARLELQAARGTGEVVADDVHVATGLLRTDAEALQRFIEYYRTHPGSREELAGEDALQRQSRDEAS